MDREHLLDGISKAWFVECSTFVVYDLSSRPKGEPEL